MNPLVVGVNCTPSSMAWLSPLSTIAGVALSVHRLDVVGWVAIVVNELVALAAKALPDRSFTPLTPPTTVRAYVVLFASGLVGVTVTVLLAALYDTVAATARLPLVKNTVPELIVYASSASLNVTVTLVPVATFAVPPAGLMAVTTGDALLGVLLGTLLPTGGVALNRTSTQ